MKKLVALILCLAMTVSIAACAKTNSASADYRKMYSSELTTMNYLVTGSENEYEVAANCVDTLVEYDKYGVVKPALAETWETSADGLTWTFHLRKDAKWLKSDKTEYAGVKAKDFVDAAKYLLNSDYESNTANVFYSVVENAEAYYNKDITDFSKVGVKAVDDYTLQYKLISPTPYFLSMLTYICFMPANGDFIKEVGEKEFGTDNTKLLYNGSYIMTTFSPQTEHVYTKNDSYWDKDNVFIKTITETYNKESNTLAPEMFKRGETDYALLSADLMSAWKNDASTKDLIAPSRNTYYTYFYAFNFDPQFDAKYEPENWKLAVNNENFRKALAAGLDRKKVISVLNPENAGNLLLNTVTPKNFVDLKGTDYTDVGDLKAITAKDSFDEAAAKSYKEKAMAELKAQGATFPVKVLMPYNPSTTGWDQECQVIEQQMENLLGKDFIDIQIEAGPATGFLSAVRKSGNYALMKCNWGPDYADPETYSDPFLEGDGTYNKPELAKGYTEADGTKTYSKLLSAAKKERTDISARYTAFAKAEAFLINNAFIIPSNVSNPGFKATKLNELEAPYSAFGVSNLRYKGQKIRDKALSTTEFNTLYDQWLKDRSAALAAAK